MQLVERMVPTVLKRKEGRTKDAANVGGGRS